MPVTTSYPTGISRPRRVKNSPAVIPAISRLSQTIDALSIGPTRQPVGIFTFHSGPPCPNCHDRKTSLIPRKRFALSPLLGKNTEFREEAAGFQTTYLMLQMQIVDRVANVGASKRSSPCSRYSYIRKVIETSLF